MSGACVSGCGGRLYEQCYFLSVTHKTVGKAFLHSHTSPPPSSVSYRKTHVLELLIFSLHALSVLLPHMNITSAHDNAVLVAPRPVRLAAPFSQFSPSFLHRPQSSKAAVRLVAAPTDAFERLKVSSDSYPSEEDLVSPSAERDRPISPRPSPLYVLCIHRTCLMTR